MDELDFDFIPRGHLTGKQERFVNEFMVDQNATQAYLRAGYKFPDGGNDVAAQKACVLMRHPLVRAAIDRRRAENAVASSQRSPLSVMLANLDYWDAKANAPPTPTYDNDGQLV